MPIHLLDQASVDCDDCVFDFVPGFLQNFNKRNGTDFKKEQITSYTMSKIMGVSPERFQYELNEFYKTPFFRNLPLLPGADNGIERLSEILDFHVLSSRPCYLTLITRNLFSRQFNGQVTRYSLLGKSSLKVPKMEEFGIKFSFEDSLEVALGAAEKRIQVGLIDQPWNQGELPEEVYRMGNWERGNQWSEEHLEEVIRRWT